MRYSKKSTTFGINDKDDLKIIYLYEASEERSKLNLLLYICMYLHTHTHMCICAYVTYVFSSVNPALARQYGRDGTDTLCNSNFLSFPISNKGENSARRNIPLLKPAVGNTFEFFLVLTEFFLVLGN